MRLFLNYSWFHRPSVLFQIPIRTQVTCTYITWLSQPIEVCSITTRPSSHVLEPSITTPKEFLFCKQTGLYILHTKWGLVVRGHLEPHGFVCLLLPRKPILCFSNSTVVVYRLITSVFSTSQHRCYWLSRCSYKHFTIWRMTQNIVKNIIGKVASSYQVNLAIEIPNITKNYINSLIFTCRHWVSAMLI